MGSLPTQRHLPLHLWPGHHWCSLTLGHRKAWVPLQCLAHPRPTAVPPPAHLPLLRPALLSQGPQNSCPQACPLRPLPGCPATPSSGMFPKFPLLSGRWGSKGRGVGPLWAGCTRGEGTGSPQVLAACPLLGPAGLRAGFSQVVAPEERARRAALLPQPSWQAWPEPLPPQGSAPGLGSGCEGGRQSVLRPGCSTVRSHSLLRWALCCGQRVAPDGKPHVTPHACGSAGRRLLATRLPAAGSTFLQSGCVCPIATSVSSSHL